MSQYSKGGTKLSLAPVWDSPVKISRQIYLTTFRRFFFPATVPSWTGTRLPHTLHLAIRIQVPLAHRTVKPPAFSSAAQVEQIGRAGSDDLFIPDPTFRHPFGLRLFRSRPLAAHTTGNSDIPYAQGRSNACSIHRQSAPIRHFAPPAIYEPK